ncbi:MAG TPA: PAS domain-containing protein [Geminicoccaceae bacterium]
MSESGDPFETIEKLRAQLSEAEETLQAIRSGAVDAVVVEGPDGPSIYTLKGADEPYRILVERMQEGAVTLSKDGTVLFANGGFAGMIAAPLEQVIGGPIDRFLPEEERQRFAALLQKARSTSVRQEFVLRRADGSEVPSLLSLGPLPVDDDVLVISMIASDLSEQKRTEQVVAAERFLRSILEQATEPIIICDAGGVVTHASQAALALSGADVIGRPLGEALALSPSGSSDAQAAAGGLARQLGQVLEGNMLSGVEVTLAGEDNERHYLLSAGPLHDPRERVVGCMVMLTDITARKRAEQHQQVLLAELSHRVKNTLASVRSIAAQTLRNTPSFEAFKGAFEGRLKALALAHGLLTQSGWNEAELGDLIRQTVLPYVTTRARSVSLSGPATFLPPRQVVTMMLIMHELAVNAAKYGALSKDSGRVAIDWMIDRKGSERILSLRWTESGGPPVRAPERTGFGTTLIERSIAHELDGRASLEYRPEGLICELRFPLRGSAADLLREAESSAEQLRSDLEGRTPP